MWIKRAAELRAQSELERDERSRDVMLELAYAYENLAKPAGRPRPSQGGEADLRAVTARARMIQNSLRSIEAAAARLAQDVLALDQQASWMARSASGEVLSSRLRTQRWPWTRCSAHDRPEIARRAANGLTGCR